MPKVNLILHIPVPLEFDVRFETKCTDFGEFLNADKLQPQLRLSCKTVTQMVSTIFKRVYAKWEL